MATNNIPVLFDLADYEAKDPTFTVKRGSGSYTKYDLSVGTADTKYTSCRVRYADPATGQVIEGTAYAEDYKADSKNNQQLEVTAKVASIAEAQTLAAKQLRLHNKYSRTATFTFPGGPPPRWPASRPRWKGGARGTGNISSSSRSTPWAAPATRRRRSSVAFWRDIDGLRKNPFSLGADRHSQRRGQRQAESPRHSQGDRAHLLAGSACWATPPFIPDYNVPQRTEFESGGSGDASFASHKHDLIIKPWMPKVNDQVLVLYLPVFNGDGFILGGI